MNVSHHAACGMSPSQHIELLWLIVGDILLLIAKKSPYNLNRVLKLVTDITSVVSVLRTSGRHLLPPRCVRTHGLRP